MQDAHALMLHLSEFSPAKPAATAEAWDALPELAPRHGLAPLIAHNIQYGLSGSGAPTVIRDSLLGHYQGALADNVLKFVTLKKLLAEVPERRAMLLDSAALADALYPHVAFRPTGELRLLVQSAELPVFVEAFRRFGHPPSPRPDPLGGVATASDDKVMVVFHTRLFPEARGAEEEALWGRAVVHRGFGRNALRPAAEDALLVQVLLLARQGFDVPLIHWVDLREFVRGSTDLGGPYSRPLDGDALRDRARRFGLERALWTALEGVARLFPLQAEAAHALQPKLRSRSSALLERLVVAPVSATARREPYRGEMRLRRLLTGG